MGIWKRKKQVCGSSKVGYDQRLPNHPKSLNSLPKLANFFVFLILLIICVLIFLSQGVEAADTIKWKLAL